MIAVSFLSQDAPLISFFSAHSLTQQLLTVAMSPGSDLENKSNRRGGPSDQPPPLDHPGAEWEPPRLLPNQQQSPSFSSSQSFPPSPARPSPRRADHTYHDYSRFPLTDLPPSKKASATFPSKLHRILENPAYVHVSSSLMRGM